MDTAELSRLLANLVRLGTVAAVDLAAARVRVDTGSNKTGWLRWLEHRAGTTRTWDPPTVGEQVMILSPSGVVEDGIVITGLFRTAHPSPSADASLHLMEFPDGARISYDHDSGALEATGIQTALIEAATHVVIDAPYTHLTGELEVDGLITYHAGMTGDGAGGNAITITGPFHHTGGDLTSNGIVLHTHVHTGVIPGGGNTGLPA